jgi:hypothetical protein
MEISLSDKELEKIAKEYTLKIVLNKKWMKYAPVNQLNDIRYLIYIAFKVATRREYDRIMYDYPNEILKQHLDNHTKEALEVIENLDLSKIIK